MRKSWRSQGTREMLFDRATGLAHNQLSSPKLLRQPWGLVFAGGSFLLSFFLLIAGGLLAAKPRALSQADTARVRQVTPGGSVVFAPQIRPIFASCFYPFHSPSLQPHRRPLFSLPSRLHPPT